MTKMIPDSIQAQAREIAQEILDAKTDAEMAEALCAMAVILAGIDAE